MFRIATLAPIEKLPVSPHCKSCSIAAFGPNGPTVYGDTSLIWGGTISWNNLLTAYRTLKNAHFAGDPTDAAWDSFADAARDVYASPPYHLVALMTALKEVQGNRKPEDLVILDHGCGGGLTCLILLANGYTGIYGIDLDYADCDKWNSLLADVLKIEDPRFFLYDGNTVPMETDSVDFVFSQQVIEHVRPNVIDQYYGEELRLLKTGGGVFHEVPHRLTPYEAHTQTWLVHYLPRPLWLWSLEKVLRKDTTTARQAIFLRWPWIHKSAARRTFGTLTDLTRKRLRTKPDPAVYDGPIGLRMALYRLFTMPIIGDVLVAVLSQMLMMQTFSRKTVQGQTSP